MTESTIGASFNQKLVTIQPIAKVKLPLSEEEKEP